MKIENNIEADELIIALVARRNVWRARAKNGEQNLEAETAVNGLLDRAKKARQEILEEQPQYRYLAVGEVIEAGDEITRHSPYDGTGWVPCHATIGRKVRSTEVGEFRRAV